MFFQFADASDVVDAYGRIVVADVVRVVVLFCYVDLGHECCSFNVAEVVGVFFVLRCRDCTDLAVVVHHHRTCPFLASLAPAEQ
eukprot:7965218-Pyramimonas_sp.AAC.1